jgi:hypothetical protein
MGRRREPRTQKELQVRLFGTNSQGQVFSAKATTVNISQQGVELSGVPDLKVDEIVGISYGDKRVHFRVKWMGKPGTPKQGHVGLVNTAPDKPFWDFPLPPPAPDGFQVQFQETRQHPRFRCQNSVELHVSTGASFWATIADLSVGGCYIEMAIPLNRGTKVRVGLWLGTAKIWCEGEVAYCTPGCGVGVRFLQVSPSDVEQIEQFLKTRGPFSNKPLGR